MSYHCGILCYYINEDSIEPSSWFDISEFASESSNALPCLRGIQDGSAAVGGVENGNKTNTHVASQQSAVSVWLLFADVERGQLDWGDA